MVAYVETARRMLIAFFDPLLPIFACFLVARAIYLRMPE